MSKRFSNFRTQGRTGFLEKDESGISYITYLNLSEGIEKFKDEDEKDYRIDILPYLIETDSHPNRKKGEETFNMNVWVHKGIGIENGSYLCMQKYFDQPCAICQKFLQLKKDYEWEEIKHLYPSKRAIYWIRDEDGELFVYDVSFKIFEELWLEQIERLEKKGKDIFPTYIDEEGFTGLEFSTTKKRGIGRYVQFDFPEIEDYDDSYKKKIVSLEKLLIIPNQEKLLKIMDGFVPGEKEYEEEDKSKVYNTNYDNIMENPEEKENKEEIKKKKKKNTDSCPFELDFGKEWDDYENCDVCKEEHSANFHNCKEIFDKVAEWEEQN